MSAFPSPVKSAGVMRSVDEPNCSANVCPVELRLIHHSAATSGRKSYSPDGSLLSCIRGKEIAILSGAEGSPVHSYPIPPYAKVNFGARWTPDGRGVIYISNAKGFSNLWIQPLDGESPRQLTSFTSGDIYNYAFSFDGTRLFVARGQQISDAVLIRNFR
jgi:Tol biopolymer transport system component